jgi:hypothetical protein
LTPHQRDGKSWLQNFVGIVALLLPKRSFRTKIEGEKSQMKKPYEKPRIIYSEKMEARAVSCAKADAGACAAGPVTS